MSMKNFYLSAKLFVSLCLAGFTNTAYAQNDAPRVVIPLDQGTTEKATVELLDDPFFYSFNDGKPTHWATAGTVTQLIDTVVILVSVLVLRLLLMWRDVLSR